MLVTVPIMLHGSYAWIQTRSDWMTDGISVGFARVYSYCSVVYLSRHEFGEVYYHDDMIDIFTQI